MTMVKEFETHTSERVVCVTWLVHPAEEPVPGRIRKYFHPLGRMSSKAVKNAPLRGVYR